MAATRAVALLCAAVASASAASRLVTINNTAPRLDSTGIILDGHDLTVRQLPNGTYVMYTTQYGLCTAALPLGCDSTPDSCGFKNDHNVSVYTSSDLSSGSWEYVGLAFDWRSRPPGIMYRPDAFFNPTTQLWVLWFNLDASHGPVYITATSPSPFGPFVDFQQSNLTVTVGGGGDFHVFFGDDPTVAYCIWSGSNHVMYVAQLDAEMRNWAGGTELYAFNDVAFVEAPAAFHRNGTWYALLGHCCCFCYQGSGLFVYTAANPLGPWTRQSSPPGIDQGDVACELPPPPPPANPFCAYLSETGFVNVTLECVNGVIDSLPVALYGTPSGDCPNYAPSATCNDEGFAAFAAATCVGKQSCVLSAVSRTDPCYGTVKAIAAVAHCSLAPGGFSPDGPVGVGAAASAVATVAVDAAGPQQPTPGQGCLYISPSLVSVTRSQQSAVLSIPDGAGGQNFIYVGDRWGQSPDGIKGHEPQYVYPLQFNANGTIELVTWNDTVSFMVEVAG
jgi:hypothetical protein